MAALSTTAVLAADKPRFGTWGFDASGMDATTRPGNDFFRHVNGAWLDRTKIPPDKPAFSLRILMTVKIEQRLHDMMENAAQKNETSDIEGKVGAFYKAFMDEARIETLGAKAITPELDAVRTAKTRDDLAGVMEKSTVDFENAIFNINTDIDLAIRNTTRSISRRAGSACRIATSPTFAAFAAAKAAYEAYVGKILHWSTGTAARAKEVVDFETKIADASGPRRRIATQATANRRGRRAGETRAGFDWSASCRTPARVAHAGDRGQSRARFQSWLRSMPRRRSRL
jgi:putative endopeptidase